MNYAKTKSVGKRQYRRKANKTIARPTTRIHQLDKTTKRCQRNPKGQTELYTDLITTDGFLTSTFLPKLKEESAQTMKKSKKFSADFFQSAKLISEHYEIELADNENLPYPYNINAMLKDLHEKLKNRLSNYQDIRLIKQQNRLFIAVEENYYTNMSLYYLPVIPLYEMLRNKRFRKLGHLLLSVYSYLYNIVEIAYYRNENSYLYMQYDMLSDLNDMNEEQNDDDEAGDDKKEIKYAEIIGDYMRKKIANRANIDVFAQRIFHFKPIDDFEIECLMVAKKTFEIFKSFPNEKITRNERIYCTNDPYDDDDDIESYATIYHYVSFCADIEGSLNRSLIVNINCELQDCNLQDPIIQSRFDGNEIIATGNSFEFRIFELLDSICRLFYEFKKN